MKLVASMIVAPAEVDRYLDPCIRHLLEFCDGVVLLAAGIPDWLDDPDWYWVRDHARINVSVGVPPIDFYAHEGRARQSLLDRTLYADPTHILAIDADEFVADGALLRQNLQVNPAAVSWSLCMQEIWNATPDGLQIRQDGGWREHDVPILYRPDGLPQPLQMPDRRLASGRTPDSVGRALSRAHTCTAIMHFGWTREPERQARYDRYVEHDGGRYHNRAHLDSIMWPDRQVELSDRDWPSALAPYRDRILAHAILNT